MSEPVITRYPPSPTGHPHMGGMRTALFNYLYAKKNKGKVILRFEDTDVTRSKKEFENSNFEALEWLGISFDAIYKQSERTFLYKKYLEKMIEEGLAYVSKEEASYDEDGEEESPENPTHQEKRDEVIRFKNPNKKVTFTDVIHGDITVDTTELKDFIIAKSLEEPLYHLAVVIDDFEMAVTHVIRGADGIYNTPRQILIGEAIGAPRPVYCHIPFVLGPDKAKLSKRNGSLPVSFYKDQGYLPEALINYLALLGWHPEGEKEIFTIGELIEAFSLERMQKGGAIFDVEKLKWVNREHIKLLTMEDFRKKTLEWLPPSVFQLPEWGDDRFNRFLPEIKDRISTFGDIKEMETALEFQYIFDKPVFEISQILPPPQKDKSPNGKKIQAHLGHLIEKIGQIEEQTFDKETLKKALWEYATKEGRGEVLWPMRMALSGKAKSPDPFTLSQIFGKNETIERLKSAFERLKKFNE